MKYIFSHWPKIKKLVRKNKYIFLLTDYDGTLTKIVSRPKNAKLDKRSRNVLKSLSKKEDFYIGVISGRSLKDVREWVGLNNIYYAGNHGLEIKGPGINFIHPLCRDFKPYLINVKRKLLSETKDIKGAFVEEKGASLSLHYRLVRGCDIIRLKHILDKICAPYIKKKKLVLSSGKKIWELKPPIKWNKGNAVGKILKVSGKKGLAIYMGDDLTDEDAFSFLKNKNALNIFVGKKNNFSKAGYFLKSPSDVRKFLRRLCQI